MMFKVGDKVVGNKNHTFDHRKGCLGVILREGHCGFWVTWENDGASHWSEESEIDLVEDTKEENLVITYKPGDKINWKWKKDKWGDNPMWQERIYTVSEDMTKAYHDDGGLITLCDKEIDYRLVKPAEEECISEKCSYKTWGEMSPEEKGALLLAHHEGKTIEYSGNPITGWLDTFGVPTWGYYVYYRVKPEKTPKEPEREVVAFKAQGHTYIKVEGKTFTSYSCGETAMYDNLAVFKCNLPDADEVFYKGDTISFVL